MYKQVYWKENLSTLCTACNLNLETRNDDVSLLTCGAYRCQMFCSFLFGNAEVKRHLCYNAVKHGVLASLKILLENKLELEGDDWGRMVSTCMHPRYSLDSAKCMPLLKITVSVIEVWNFRSQFLCNGLLVSHLAAIYGKSSYWLPIVGIQFLLLKKKKNLPDFLGQELQ